MNKTELVIGVLSLREPPENYPQTIFHIMTQHLAALWEKHGWNERVEKPKVELVEEITVRHGTKISVDENGKIVTEKDPTVWDDLPPPPKSGNTRKRDFTELMPHVLPLVAELAWLMADGEIEDRHVKKILEDAFETEPEYWSLVGYLADTRILDEAEGNDLKDIVLKVLEDNEKAREDIRNGKKKAIGHLVGQVMKAAKGKANPKQASEMIQELV